MLCTWRSRFVLKGRIARPALPIDARPDLRRVFGVLLAQLHHLPTWAWQRCGRFWVIILFRLQCAFVTHIRVVAHDPPPRLTPSPRRRRRHRAAFHARGGTARRGVSSNAERQATASATGKGPVGRPTAGRKVARVPRPSFGPRLLFSAKKRVQRAARVRRHHTGPSSGYPLASRRQSTARTSRQARCSNAPKLKNGGYTTKHSAADRTRRP